MLFIGITGGVGAGKSAILSFLENHYNCRVMLADLIAHEQMEPGTDCYKKLQQVFEKDDVWEPDGHFHRNNLAKILFTDETKREQLNDIVHPAVKQYVKEQWELERKRGTLDLLVVEAALLIEEKYNAICDELWYIYTSEENRRERLKKNRGYSDEKIDQIFQSQLKEEEFQKACQAVIDNNHSPEEAFKQMEEQLEKRHIVKNV